MLVRAQNNILYSLTIGLTGASWTAAVTNLRGLPAYSAKSLWVTSGDYLQRQPLHRRSKKRGLPGRIT